MINTAKSEYNGHTKVKSRIKMEVISTESNICLRQMRSGHKPSKENLRTPRAKASITGTQKQNRE